MVENRLVVFVLVLTRLFVHQASSSTFAAVGSDALLSEGGEAAALEAYEWVGEEPCGESRGEEAEERGGERGGERGSEWSK